MTVTFPLWRLEPCILKVLLTLNSVSSLYIHVTVHRNRFLFK